MQFRLTRKLKRSLLALAWLAVSARLLIPIGYMPAPIGEGGLIFCPGDRVTAMPSDGPHRNGHDHRGHDENPTDKHGGELAWNQCPYGALAKSALVPFELAPAVVSDRSAAVPAPPARFRAHALTSAFRARAPPVPSA